MIIVIFMLYSCAKVGYPEGGPQDVVPPALKKAEPANYAMNAMPKKIKIEFNEYISLKNINQELIVNPFMPKNPEVIYTGKGIIIKKMGVLKPNTTYTFNFGNAITDNNENNVLSNFVYAFSTGNYIDSLIIPGNVLDAFTLEPIKENIYVVLHDTIADSSVYSKNPAYIAKVNKEGRFLFENVRTGKYLMYALVDANKNMKYDLETEQIGFLDSLLILDNRFYITQDTLIPIDTTSSLNKKLKLSLKDSIQLLDSIQRIEEKMLSISINLKVFKELRPFKKQYIKDYARTSPALMQFVFNRELINNCNFKFITDSLKDKAYISTMNPSKDTLKVWIEDSSVFKLDKFKVSIAYYTYDSLNKEALKIDTLTMTYMGKRESRKLKLTEANIINGILDLKSNYIIQSVAPIKDFYPEKLVIYEKIDTLYVKIPYEYSKTKLNDSLVFENKYSFSFPTKENTSYKVAIDSMTFVDVLNRTNTKDVFLFATQKEEYYGHLILNLKIDNDYNYIVQLIDSRDNIYRQETLSKEKSNFVFSYITPQDYTIKAICDKNNNKAWDTGDLQNKIQPEPIYIFENPITVRANWDTEQNWTIIP